MNYKAYEHTLSSLSVELGMDHRRVGKLLKGLQPHKVKGRSKYYYMRDVLSHLMADGNELDKSYINTRLALARLEKAERENEVARGHLCDVKEVNQIWIDHIIMAKTKLRALPHQLTHLVMAAQNNQEAMIIMLNGIDDALNDLAKVK